MKKNTLKDSSWGSLTSCVLLLTLSLVTTKAYLKTLPFLNNWIDKTYIIYKAYTYNRVCHFLGKIKFEEKSLTIRYTDPILNLKSSKQFLQLCKVANLPIFTQKPGFLKYIFLYKFGFVIICQSLYRIRNFNIILYGLIILFSRNWYLFFSC